MNVQSIKPGMVVFIVIKKRQIIFNWLVDVHMKPQCIILEAHQVRGRSQLIIFNLNLNSNGFLTTIKSPVCRFLLEEPTLHIIVFISMVRDSKKS